jgi:hypothetical protein
MKVLWIGAPHDGEVFEVLDATAHVRTSKSVGHVDFLATARNDPDRSLGIVVTNQKTEDHDLNEALARCRELGCVRVLLPGPKDR